MKKMLLAVCALLLTGGAYAQERPDTTYWSKKGIAGVNLSQVGLSNWSAGGDGSVAFDAMFNYNLDYQKGKHLWQNRLELAYGLNNTDSKGTRKTNDKIYFNTMYGYKFAENWYVSLAANYQSQFAKGYDYNISTENFISRFMAPGYLSAGPGVTWTPKKWFHATLSPATWRGTFVLDDKLSDEGAFGVDPGKHFLSEFGGNLTMEASYEFLPNMSVNSRLNLFSNYLDKPQNVDVRWDTQVNMKINKWFSANVTLNMLYDDDIKILQKDGSKGSRLQIKEVLGIGFQATF